MNKLYYIGIDIHKKFLQMAVLDDDGTLVDIRRISTMDKESLKEYLQQFTHLEKRRCSRPCL